MDTEKNRLEWLLADSLVAKSESFVVDGHRQYRHSRAAHTATPTAAYLHHAWHTIEHGSDLSSLPLPQFVYRHYDNRDRLLYVGVTDDPHKRFSSHTSKSKKWSGMVDLDKTTYEYVIGRPEALQREREIIESENPIHNVQGRR